MAEIANIELDELKTKDLDLELKPWEVVNKIPKRSETNRLLVKLCRMATSTAPIRWCLDDFATFKESE